MRDNRGWIRSLCSSGGDIAPSIYTLTIEREWYHPLISRTGLFDSISHGLRTKGLCGMLKRVYFRHTFEWEFLWPLEDLFKSEMSQISSHFNVPRFTDNLKNMKPSSKKLHGCLLSFFDRIGPILTIFCLNKQKPIKTEASANGPTTTKSQSFEHNW